MARIVKCIARGVCTIRIIDVNNANRRLNMNVVNWAISLKGLRHTRVCVTIVKNIIIDISDDWSPQLLVIPTDYVFLNDCQLPQRQIDFPTLSGGEIGW